MANILVIHGPNLNLLGQREQQHYGTQTLSQINDTLAQLAKKHGHLLRCVQYNAEHHMIEAIHGAKQVNFILINAAAYTHTSIALRDALLASTIPFIEVHLSNIYARESFRQQSLLADIAQGVITGFGATSYELALRAAIETLEK